jgi:outer membrane protein assembly factor BamB
MKSCLGLFLLMLFVFAPMACALQPFSFARITDTHIGNAGSNVAPDAERVAFLNTLTPRPDFVINTGDLVDEGTAIQYQTYRDIFDRLAMPRYDIPGNHDVRWAPLGKESIQAAMHIPLFRSFDHGGCHFVLLDSTVTLEHWGHFEADEMRWLADDLRKTGIQTPVFVFLHHWIGRDPTMVDNEAEFFRTIAPYNVKIVFCGHGHSDIQWRVNGVQYVMERGLYQGSFDVTGVTPTVITLSRYRKEDAAPTVLAVVPTTRQPAVSVQAHVTPDGRLDAAFSGSVPPTGFRWEWRADTDGPWHPMSPAPDGSKVTAMLDPQAVSAGRHRINVRLVLPLPLERRKESHDQADDNGDLYLASVAWDNAGSGPVAALWRTELGGAIQSRLVSADGTVFVSCFDGTLYALDAKTGRTRWKFLTHGPLFSTPCLADGLLYVGSMDHSVYAVDAATGRLRWRTVVGGPVFAGVCVGAGIACVGAGDGIVSGLDALTGVRRWTFAAQNFVQSQAAFGSGAFYIGAWDNGFYALESMTGKLRWHKVFGKGMFYSPAIGAPAVWGDSVFVPSNDGTLHAVNTATGEIAWEALAPSGAGKFGYSSPVVTQDGRLYIGTLGDTGSVVCLDARTGKLTWRADTGSVIYDSSCAVSGGVVTIGSVNGDFHALSALDGKVLGTYHLGTGHLLASPAMTPDGRTAFIGSMGNAVTALHIAVAP